MSLRAPLLVLAAAGVLGIVGCSGLPAAVSPAVPPNASASASPATAVVSARPSPSAPTPVATAKPDTGNVGAPVTPSLSVESVGALGIRVTLADPAAKAWRVTVAATGAAPARSGADRWTMTIETGDVSPIITTTETLNGNVGDLQEQPALEAGSATGRVCSLAVPVCVRAASVVLPNDGNGTLVLEIGRTDTSTNLAVTGATATWPGEPFMLGPWTTTAAFPWRA